jgi:hypothetical protein
MFYVLYPFVTYLLPLPRSIGTCRQISLELTNIKIHENEFIGSRVVSRDKRMDGETLMGAPQGCESA